MAVADPAADTGSAYPESMSEAKRRSAWRRSYDLTLDGRPVARWDSSLWKNTGTIEVDGRRADLPLPAAAS